MNATTEPKSPSIIVPLPLVWGFMVAQIQRSPMSNAHSSLKNSRDDSWEIHGDPDERTSCAAPWRKTARNTRRTSGTWSHHHLN